MRARSPPSLFPSQSLLSGVAVPVLWHWYTGIRLRVAADTGTAAGAARRAPRARAVAPVSVTILVPCHSDLSSLLVTQSSPTSRPPLSLPFSAEAEGMTTRAVFKLRRAAAGIWGVATISHVWSAVPILWSTGPTYRQGVLVISRTYVIAVVGTAYAR